MTDWREYAQRTHGAMRNNITRVTLTLGDDSQAAAQLYQAEGYPSELRSNLQRLQHWGASSFPLPGAKGIAHFQGGYRGFGTILGVEDPRYRQPGLKPGEHVLYYVDGAGADGSGGTVRNIVEGRQGGVTKLSGIHIQVGDGTTQDVTITRGSITLTMSGNTLTISNGSGSPQPVKLADGSNSQVLRSV